MRCACAIYRGISRVTRYNFFYRTVTKHRDTAQPYRRLAVGRAPVHSAPRARLRLWPCRSWQPRRMHQRFAASQQLLPCCAAAMPHHRPNAGHSESPDCSDAHTRYPSPPAPPCPLFLFCYPIFPWYKRYRPLSLLI